MAKIGATKRLKIFKNTMEELDFYWSILIKAKAGFVSELSGLEGDLHSHHLRGKPNYSLRYSLENGICITSGEHKFGFHHAGRQYDYEQKVKLLRGNDIFDRIMQLKNSESESTMQIRSFLLNELKQHEKQIKSYFESKEYKTKKIIDKWKYLFEKLKNFT